MVLKQMRVNCTLNLLETDQENILKIQAKKVRWQHPVAGLSLHSFPVPIHFSEDFASVT